MEGLEEGLDDTSLAARLSAPAPVVVPKPEARDKSDPAAKEIAAQNDSSLVDWFRGFAGTTFKISLNRIAPETWEGRNVAGHLANFDELIEEDQIAERFGGGKYQIKAMKLNPNGKYTFGGARTFKIAGDPKITGEHFKADKDGVIPLPLAAVANPDSELTKAALGSMERFSLKAIERAEKIEDAARGVSPFDANVLAIVTKPLESQIVSLNAQIAAKDALLLEKDRIIKDLSERRPDTTMQDRLLDKMYDGENAKLNALRAQHDSERRVLQDNFAEEKKRMEHRSDTERQNLIESHKRELKQLEQSYEYQLKASDLSHKGLLDAKENRLKDLERTIGRQDAEIAELRAKKEKTIQEQMHEMAQLKETMSALGMGGEDKGEESTTERVIGMIAENPIVQGIGRRISQPEARPPQQQAPAPQQLSARRARAKAAQQQATQTPGAAPPPARSAPLPAGVSVEGVQAAVGMMEGAVENGTEPTVFAQSIRGMVPTGVVNYIQVHGIDSLLDGVARLSEASPLQTQVGRTFARAVAKALAAT
jgi:uncharacterized coiled-coil protein SlyX